MIKNKKINKVLKLIISSAFCTSLIGLNPTNAAVTPSGATVEFVSPADNTSTSNNEIDVEFNIQFHDQELLNKDIKVSIIVAEHNEYFNDPGALSIRLNEQGVVKTVRMTSTDSIQKLTFDNIPLPFTNNNSSYKGENVIFCSYDYPDDNSDYFRICTDRATGTQKFANITVINTNTKVYPTTATPLYRFYSQQKQGHFYTTNAAEKTHLMYTNSGWKYEGVAYHVGGVNADETCKDLNQTKIFRFWNATSMHHFYTANEAEKNALVSGNPSWKYEGVGFCADTTKVANSEEVYRFYSAQRTGHFFTISEGEKESLIKNDQSWAYENVAYYAFE